MTKANRSDLTAEERDLVGGPGDLVTEALVPARKRSSTVLVSLRMDRRTFDDIGRVAERRGSNFSDVARDALRTFVSEHRAKDAYPDVGHSNAHRRASETRQLSWDDAALRQALERYEAQCLAAGMREKAWRSYVDYARRFLAWREGEYHPRGVAAGDRPVPRGTVRTHDLRTQARSYVEQVHTAGRAQDTIDTYFRHAMFFIRWLDGTFEPGAKLRGL